MRLFTAIELSDAVRAGAGVLLNDLQERARRIAPAARLTWIPAERLHLTVRFIGEVADAQAERIIAALRRPLRLDPFAARLDGLGTFPDRGTPRVIWLGVAEGRESMQEAARAIGERLREVGIPDEERPLRPHLTLARVRDAGGLRAGPLLEGLSPRMGPMPVDAITLFRSRLSPKGPAYEVLERTPLRRA